MLQLTPQSVIFVATVHIDFRKGIDGLIAVCKQKFSLDPINGSIFLFYNKAKTTIKILSYDGQGFWLCTKRLSQGTFYARKVQANVTVTYQQVCYRSLYILINNGDPRSAKLAKDWRSLP
jgi:transposase